MSTQVTTKSVPYSYKLAFGFGMLANQMFPAVLSIFMVVLVQDLGFPGWMWGLFSFFRVCLMHLLIRSWVLFRIIHVRNGADVDSMCFLALS